MSVPKEKPSTILVVDDDESVRSALHDMLESEGYEVVTATDGRDALAKLGESQNIGLILLDLKMPVMDGWEFLAERDVNPILRRIPIVLLSGMAFIPDAPGVADFIAKPIRSSRLLSCVRRLCR